MLRRNTCDILSSDVISAERAENLKSRGEMAADWKMIPKSAVHPSIRSSRAKEQRAFPSNAKRGAEAPR